jgi:hypothetical protein
VLQSVRLVVLGRRTSRRPVLRPFRLAAQLTPHLELNDFRRPRSLGPRHGMQMPVHQLSPL